MNVVVSLTPKTPRVAQLVAAAKNTKCLQDLIIKALELYLSSEEGAKMEKSILAMEILKKDLSLKETGGVI